MKWSKSKKALEKLFAESVKKHVQFYVTQYGPGQSYTMARGWVTWDGQEIANFSSVEHMTETYQMSAQIREANHTTDFRDAEQHDGYNLAYNEARRIVQKKGIFSRDQFQDAVETYLSLSIEEALNSDNLIIKALSMFDRRLGQRRLIKLQIGDSEPALVKLFYRLRCQADELVETH